MLKFTPSASGATKADDLDNHAVLISRDVWENPVFCDYREVSLLVWMITTAAPEPGTVRTRWGEVPLKTGEILASERDMAKQFEMHPNKVRKVLARMIEAGMVSKGPDQPIRQAGTVWAVEMSKFSRRAPLQ